MSVDNFIPTLWTARILANLHKTHVFAGVANRDYEGEIKQKGDTVMIPQIGDITVSTYTKGSTTISYQDIVDAASVLQIDQSKYFAFQVHDADAVQANRNFRDDAMNEAVYALRDTVDAYFAGLYASCGLAQNSSASPVDMTSLNVEEEIIAVSETMTENKVPTENRFGIVAPWVHTKLLLAGIASLTENVDIWKNGFVGRFAGFDLYVSNNVSKNSTSWDITRNIFGVKGKSFTFAEQIVSTEALRLETSFADGIRGYHLYGGKIVRPDMTCVLYADKTSEPS